MPAKDFPRISTALTLDPHPEENLVSYIFRLANYRCLSSAWMLVSACKFTCFTNQPPPEAMTELAATACVDEQDLWAISYGRTDRTWATFRGQRISRATIERRGSAERWICPTCMDEIPAHRAIWDLRYVAICPVHRVLLMDVCPACTKPIRWRGGDLTRCVCEGMPEFSSFVAEDAAPGDISATAAVYGLMGDPRFQRESDEVRAQPLFRDMGGANIAEFLYRMGLERAARPGKFFSSENPGDLAWKAHITLRLGMEATAIWPSGFYRVIDGMRERSRLSAASSMRVAAGAVERWLAGLPEGEGSEISRALQEYRLTDRDGEIGKPRRPATGGIS
jgi:hypothetical protein